MRSFLKHDTLSELRYFWRCVMSLMKKDYFLSFGLGILVLTISESFCFRNPPDSTKYKDSPKEFYDTSTVHCVSEEEFSKFMLRHRDVFLSQAREIKAQMKEINRLMERSLRFLDKVFGKEGWTPGEHRLFSNWDLSCDIHEEQRVKKEFFASCYETDKFNDKGILETATVICPFKLLFGNSSHDIFYLHGNEMSTPHRFRIFLSRVCGFQNGLWQSRKNRVYPTCGCFIDRVGIRKKRERSIGLDELENRYRNGLFKRGYFYTEIVTFDCCVKNDSPYFNGIDFSKPENVILDDQAFTSIFSEETQHWEPILNGISDWYITQCALFESRKIYKEKYEGKSEKLNIYNPLFPLIYVLKLAGGDFRNMIGIRDALWAIRDRSRSVPTVDWKDEYICLGDRNPISSDYPITVMQQYILTTIGFEYLKNLPEYIKDTIDDICNDCPSLVKEYAEEISKRLNKNVSRYKNLNYLPFLHFALFSKSHQNQIMEFLNTTCISAKNSSYSKDFFVLSKFLCSAKIDCKTKDGEICSVSEETFNNELEAFDIIDLILNPEIAPKAEKYASLANIEQELNWMNEILLIMNDDVSRTIGNLITIQPLMCDGVGDYSINVPIDNYFGSEQNFYFSLRQSNANKKMAWVTEKYFPSIEVVNYKEGRVWRANHEFGHALGIKESLERVFISPSRAKVLDRVWNVYVSEMKIPRREALFRMLLETGGNYDYIAHIRNSFFKGSYVASGVFKRDAYLTSDQKYLIAKHFHTVLGVSQFYAATFAYCRNEKDIRVADDWDSKNKFKQSDIYNFFNSCFFSNPTKCFIDEWVIIAKYEEIVQWRGETPEPHTTAMYSLSDLIFFIMYNYDNFSDKSYLSYVASIIGRDPLLERVISDNSTLRIDWSKWNTIINGRPR